MSDQGSYASTNGGGSRRQSNSHRSSNNNNNNNSSDPYSNPHTYSNYRDDVSVGVGSVSNAPVWSNHPSSRNPSPPETFDDEDQFSFSPVTSSSIPVGGDGTTIVGSFRPSLEDMVDVNVSRHGKSFNNKNNSMMNDRTVRRSSVFSMCGDTPFETVGMKNRGCLLWCCFITLFIIMAIIILTLSPSGAGEDGTAAAAAIVDKNNNNNNNNGPTNIVPDTHSMGTDFFIDPTLTPSDCDFTDILQPDVFLQCRCRGHISVFSESMILNYNTLKRTFMKKEFPRYHSQLDSCAPPNVAHAWLASDTYGDEQHHDQRDRYVLTLLYAAWKGAGWTNQENWLLTSQSHCDWYGVECDSSNRTIDLLLNDNNLVGTLPTQVVKLDSLMTLAIADNQLDGRLPRELGDWQSIQRLQLSGNGFIFSIPTELGNLENLQSLELDHNHLHGTIPTEIMRLPLLTNVGLWANRLTGTIPTEVGNLAVCREFKVYSNSLTGSIPTEVGTMPKLKIWQSARNANEGPIPSEFGNVQSLQSLDISSMRLTGTIPTQLGNLVSLETLTLSDNSLNGPIPSQIGAMLQLQFLYVNHNSLTGSMPFQLSQLRDLTKLECQENKMTGTIPKELASCDKLERIDLSANLFKGNVPNEVCSLRSLKLTSMIISNCQNTDAQVTCAVPDCCTECAP